MSAKLKEEIARLERISEKDSETISNLREQIVDLKEELNHYRTAVAAVKWLMDQAQNQRPFQL